MKLSKIFYYTGIVVGCGCILAEHIFWGFSIMLLALFASMMADPKFYNSPSENYSTRTEKDFYYKDEFEEYKHYEFINKKGIYKNK